LARLLEEDPQGQQRTEYNDDVNTVENAARCDFIQREVGRVRFGQSGIFHIQRIASQIHLRFSSHSSSACAFDTWRTKVFLPCLKGVRSMRSFGKSIHIKSHRLSGARPRNLLVWNAALAVASIRKPWSASMEKRRSAKHLLTLEERLALEAEDFRLRAKNAARRQRNAVLRRAVQPIPPPY
jgi:hypothetical protein